MKIQTHFLIFLSVFMPTTAFSNDITVEILNVGKAGELHLAIYDDARAFENDTGERGGVTESIFGSIIQKIEPSAATFRFELPEGIYAIGIFVDTNYNNKLDRNVFGIPIEQFGFSQDARGHFGPPTFQDASFIVSDDATLQIRLSPP